MRNLILITAFCFLTIMQASADWDTSSQPQDPATNNHGYGPNDGYAPGCSTMGCISR